MNVRKIFNLGMALMLTVTSLAVSQPVAAAKAPEKFTPRIAPGAQTMPGEVVVAFADTGDKTLVEKIEQAVETANVANGEVTRLALDGSAVIRVDGDTTAALDELNAQPDVLYAELNYVYSVPVEAANTADYGLTSEFVFRSVTPSASTNGKSIMAVPHSTIQNMVAMGTYPTDTYLNSNQAWFNMGADIVWPNVTKSVNVCEIDTGVDRLHPDLRKKVGTTWVYNIINGYDFVNADALPDDDNGHGTHVAGIMVAVGNNKIGVNGVSTGKVVAVKALDAQGIGTNFDISKAIQYCANRTDIHVINLSLGGPADSALIKDALIYATTATTVTIPSGSYAGLKGKGKLVVAAAGNTIVNVDIDPTKKIYPAAYATDIAFAANSILSVGSTGKQDAGGEVVYNCMAPTSKYGDWVTVLAPGEHVYSTTPYDKPFYQNFYAHLKTRYDYMSGTSMAAAFVSASAARRWGYKPTKTNVQVGGDIIASGDTNMDEACTPQAMWGKPRVNVATLLDRTGIRVSVFDAASGVPLSGASVGARYLYAGAYAIKSAVIPAIVSKDIFGLEPDPTRVFTYYNQTTDIVDIPTADTLGNPIQPYSLLVNKVGYTVGYQPAFQQDTIPSLDAGSFNVFINGAVPPRTPNFSVVLGWHKWQQGGYQEAVNANDLDLYIWLPGPVHPDLNQPANFIVGYNGDANGQLDGDSYGALTAFPFARLNREGGYTDDGPAAETTMISRRLAHGTVLANSTLPYYAGSYIVYATDYGQTIDQDGDGCGDNYGYNYHTPLPPPPAVPDPNIVYYDPKADPDCYSDPVTQVGTLGIPLLGAYFTPYVYVWKDGYVKSFVDGSNNFGPFPAGDPCNTSWWKALRITSGSSGTAPTYVTFDQCDNGSTNGFFPYAPSPTASDRVITYIFGK